jgi:hypothetical protein
VTSLLEQVSVICSTFIWHPTYGIQLHSTNSVVSLFIGASVLAAQSSNRAIVALEGDKELYEELLMPLQVAASERHRVDQNYFVDLDDDDDTVPQQGAVSLCE